MLGLSPRRTPVPCGSRAPSLWPAASPSRLSVYAVASAVCLSVHLASPSVGLPAAQAGSLSGGGALSADSRRARRGFQGRPQAAGCEFIGLPPKSAKLHPL